MVERFAPANPDAQSQPRNALPAAKDCSSGALHPARHPTLPEHCTMLLLFLRRQLMNSIGQ
jgi:hypothetical protein